MYGSRTGCDMLTGFIKAKCMNPDAGKTSTCIYADYGDMVDRTH